MYLLRLGILTILLFMWGYPTPRSELMLRNPNCASAVQSKKVLRAEQTFLIAPHCEGTKKRRFHPRQEIWTAKPICLIRSRGDVHWHSPCTPSPSVCVGFWVVGWVRAFCLGLGSLASLLAPSFTALCASLGRRSRPMPRPYQSM